MQSSFLSPRSSISTDAVTRVTGENVAFAISRGLAKRSKFSAPRSAWLVSREFDILFVCGLAPWLIGVVFFLVTGAGGAYPPTKFPQQAMTFLFVVCSLVIGESHQFTSIVRYYTAFKKRGKSYKWQRVPFWFVYALVAEFLLFSVLGPDANSILEWTLPFVGAVLQGFIMAFPAVLMQHVCGQATAIVQQYCRTGNYEIGKDEKFALTAFSWLLTATGVVTIAVPFGFNSFNSTTFTTTANALSSYVGPLTQLTVAASFVIAARVIYRGLTLNQWPPLGATLLLLNLVLLVLLAVPLSGMAYVWLFVPLFFHATQHWAVAWYTRRRETATGSYAAWTRKEYVEQICAFVMPILLVTLFVLFLPLFCKQGPRSGPFAMLLSGETLSVFFSMLVFYIHYFADRVVWRPKY